MMTRRRALPTALITLGVLAALAIVGRTGSIGGGLRAPSAVTPATSPPPRNIAPPQTPWIVARIPIPARGQADQVTDLAFAGDRLWLDTTAGLVRVDPGRNRVDRTLAAAKPAAATAELTGRAFMVATADTLWVADYGRDWDQPHRHRRDPRPFLRLIRVDAQTGTAQGRAKVKVPYAPPAAAAAGQGGVWIGCCDPEEPNAGRVLRLDPVTLQPTAATRLDHAVCALAVGPGAVWVLDQAGAVVRIEPTSNRIVGRVRALPGGAAMGSDATCGGIAAAAGAVWVANRLGELARLDPATGLVTALTTLVRGGQRLGVVDLATTGDRAWVTSDRGELYALDRQGRMVAAAGLVGAERIAVGAGAVWVSDRHGMVIRVHPARVPPPPPG